jgi:hypothetical protein
MAFLLPGIVPPLLPAVLGAAPGALSPVNHHLPDVGEHFDEPFRSGDFPLGQVMGLARHCFKDGPESLDPSAGLAFGNPEKKARQLHRRVHFQVEQYEEKHAFAVFKRVPPTAARRPLPLCAGVNPAIR